MKKFWFPLTFVLFAGYCLHAQNTDSTVISKIFKNSLSDTGSYHNLRILTSKYPGRLAGTEASLNAVRWTSQELKKYADTVWLQKCMVRRWDRGGKDVAEIRNGGKIAALSVCALGGSVGTGKNGITAGVVEVRDYDELKKIGKDGVRGKILFINHPVDPSLFNTFAGYGEVAGYRVRGANQAAWYGAAAMVVRSATSSMDNFPHTGIMHYADTVSKIPAFAVSTKDADHLSILLKKDPDLKLFLRSMCHDLPDTVSYNVIAEIKGSEKPDEVIAFGGHIDCWDNSDGAHDDGAGVVQTMDVLRLWKSLGMKPKHTIRVVVFMDEEMEQRGAKAYGEGAKDTKHLAAIEADRGGFAPLGFSIDASDQVIRKVQSWKPLLLPYGIYSLEKGGGGVDVRELKQYGTPLFGLVPDAQRYFEYHHSANDTFDKISIRELQLGTAAVSALVYLIDTYGL